MLMAYMVRSDKLEFKPGVGFPGDEGYGKEDGEAKFYYFDDFVDYWMINIRNNSSGITTSMKMFISSESVTTIA